MGDIAKENNIAIGTVYNYIKKYGIVSRKKLTEKARKTISEKNKGKISNTEHARYHMLERNNKRGNDLSIKQF